MIVKGLGDLADALAEEWQETLDRDGDSDAAAAAGDVEVTQAWIDECWPVARRT